MEDSEPKSGAWFDVLNVNPLPTLFAWDDPALHYFVRRDLLGEPAGPLESLWDAPEPVRLIRRQQPDGSWRYPGKSYDPETGTQYDLLETYRTLRVLVETYGFHHGHPALVKAAEYVLTYQTDEGDIRGIIGNQYMPYYHGAILELLVKAGYEEDARIEKGLEWLLSVRQDDGGWIVPAQAVPSKQRTIEFWLGAPVPPARARPHAHLATGMALRPFAAHPAYRGHPAVIAAGHALKSRFFQGDKYNDRKAPSYWLKFQFPFWWTSLLTALDTLTLLGFDRHDRDVSRGLEWFLTNQSADGLWETGYGAGRGAQENRCRVGLAVCRVLERLFQAEKGGPQRDAWLWSA
ncbi:MAG: terpene cyclase/mutase family protein [Anaerolineae bacterium]|nr:terpene cyclase/mutase family protein [Anaerolineae bacterium]